MRRAIATLFDLAQRSHQATCTKIIINILRYSLFGIAGGQEVDLNFS